jgi:hypothetical protein
VECFQRRETAGFDLESHDSGNVAGEGVRNVGQRSLNVNLIVPQSVLLRGDNS